MAPLPWSPLGYPPPICSLLPAALTIAPPPPPGSCHSGAATLVPSDGTSPFLCCVSKAGHRGLSPVDNPPLPEHAHTCLLMTRPPPSCHGTPGPSTGAATQWVLSTSQPKSHCSHPHLLGYNPYTLLSWPVPPILPVTNPSTSGPGDHPGQGLPWQPEAAGRPRPDCPATSCGPGVPKGLCLTAGSSVHPAVHPLQGGGVTRAALTAGGRH